MSYTEAVGVGWILTFLQIVCTVLWLRHDIKSFFYMNFFFGALALCYYVYAIDIWNRER